MSDKQEPIVGEGEDPIAKELQTVLWKFYLENEEYDKIICVGEGCGKAIDPWFAGKHLELRHNVDKVIARRITKKIREGGVNRRGSDKGIPEDGLGPQEGIAVFDGVRCRCCGQFKARSVREVEDHWRLARHEETKGSMIEGVRMQSWGGWDGLDQRYWVVDEDKCGMSEGETVGEKSEEGEEWVGGDPTTLGWSEAELCEWDEVEGDWVVMH